MAYTKYSLTPADNNAAPPNGAPEGMLPSGVNDTMRDMMAQIRDVGDGIRDGTYTMTAPKITGGSITGVALTGNTFTNPVITGAAISTSTLTGNTFTNPVISGGSINNTPIGATTATTGAFTTATVAKVEDSQGGVLAPISSVMRNRIINGAMVIDQRNAGASVTPTIDNTYTLDRWSARLSAASKFSVQQTTTAPVGFNNSLKVTSLAATSLAASDYYNIIQVIEGYNVGDLNWGTANAKTITLSFQVQSSLTGTFGGSLITGGGYSYPFTYSIPVANTWTTISVTVTGPTTGTWVISNTAGVQVWFGLGVGSTYSATAGSWVSGNYLSATGATSVVGTNGATFYLTGVQLEKGTQATSFDYRQFTTELQLCQRYYSTGTSYLQTSGTAPGGLNFFSSALKVTMRAAPTAAVASTIAGTSTSISFITVDQLAFLGIPDVNGRVAGTWTAAAEL